MISQHKAGGEAARMRRALTGLSVDLALIRLGRVLSRSTKYDASQPRLPAGQPGGGQWAGGNSSGTGNGANEADADGPNAQIDAPQSTPALQTTPQGSDGWREQVRARHADGTVASEIALNADGTAIASDYDPTGAKGWTDRHIVRLPDGEIVAFENAGLAQTIRDGDGNIVSSSVWGPEGPEQQARVEEAFSDPKRLAVRKVIEAGMSLFTFMSTRNRNGEQAVLAFTARDYKPGEEDASKLEYVGALSKDEVTNGCPRLPEVQARADDAARGIDRNGMSPTAYGTAVHLRMKDGIDRLEDPNFRAERSLLKTKEAIEDNENPVAIYGQLGTVRIDVLEQVGNGTTCVYDLKTGRSGLSAARSAEIARTVSLNYPATQRIIVTEIRPSE